MHVAIVGTYPPTRCGIATFTADVESALRLNDAKVTVVHVTTDDSALASLSIRRDDPLSYSAAAQRLNALDCDVVLIQHEFGIFGGTAGGHVLHLVEALNVPYVVTLHTVLPRFSDDESQVVQAVCQQAAAVTVFTSTARRLLLEQELAPARLLRVVAHGAPLELYTHVDDAHARNRLGLPLAVPVMSTFGLLSAGKGIELAIHAMALLRSEHPDLHYIVAGRTHPEVVKRDGERYRESLIALTQDLELSDRVIFLDRFLEMDELAGVLGISDVVCTPYRGEDQSVSGVLTFALAAGCPIVSTPYRYARDVLADGAGVIVDFGDDEGFAVAIHHLLDGPTSARARAAARQASAQMPWPTVGAALHAVLSDAVRRPVVVALKQSVTHQHRRADIKPGVAHLRLLCDDTAILQHAHYNVPRVEDGYCIDDAGRMLPIAAHLSDATGDDCWYITVGRLLAFIRAAMVDGKGNMRNFMSWDRHWLDEPYLGDHVGRAVWGLGELIAADGPFAEEARHVMDDVAPTILPSWPMKSLAYAALGLAAASTKDVRRVGDLDRIAGELLKWEPSGAAGWTWCEPRLSYDNARIPEALLRVGHQLADHHLVDNGATMLAWLEGVCRRGDHYRFPGHRGMSDTRELTWSGDEQPLEAAAMADAHLAWLTLSGDAESLDAISRAWTWFLGNNRLGEALVEIGSGAGFDGLGAMGPNKNRGAESTIAAHRCRIAWDAARPADQFLKSEDGVATLLVSVAERSESGALGRVAPHDDDRPTAIRGLSM
jgi:glycosyltransferase involved in cell wall biosynthesis